MILSCGGIRDIITVLMQLYFSCDFLIGGSDLTEAEEDEIEAAV